LERAKLPGTWESLQGAGEKTISWEDEVAKAAKRYNVPQRQVASDPAKYGVSERVFELKPSPIPKKMAIGYDPGVGAQELYSRQHEVQARQDIGAQWREFAQKRPGLPQRELIRLFNQQYQPQALGQ
jgi:hypothetical protein